MVTKDQVEEQQFESTIDDYQSIELEFDGQDGLIEKFITPIELIRSKSAPEPTAQIGEDVSPQTTPQESRAHAFYRLMGLPCIAADGSFYNPGFDPLSRSDLDFLQVRKDINSRIPPKVKQAISARETEARARYGYFANKSPDTSVYSIALAIPSGQKPINMTNASVNALENADEQSRALNARAQFITTRFQKRDGTDITNTFSDVKHKLRPFMTDPVIEIGVQPNSGSGSVKVAAPFITENAAEISKGNFLKRPGIEFILRLRLRELKLEAVSAEEIANVDTTLFPDDVSANTSAVVAALVEIGIPQSEITNLSGAALLEVNTIQDLTKTYKGLIGEYISSIETIENVYKSIAWIPLSNAGGPERGTLINNIFIKPKKFESTWELNQRILRLEHKAAIAKRQNSLGTDQDDVELSTGRFAIQAYQNVGKLYEEELQQAQNEIDRFEAAGSDALRKIELIAGEVSGLGLIDIIAIYMAMWSVPVSVLLNLLDDKAIERLLQIPDLITSEVSDRFFDGADALSAYKDLEDRIISILSYGDRLVSRYLQQESVENDGGSPFGG